MNLYYIRIATLASLCGLCGLSNAQKRDSINEINEVTITSTGLKGKVKDYSGSVTIISAKQIKELSIPTIGDAMRFVPGSNYIDEDGRGLRPGIGLRGMDPSRNTHTLVLINGKIPIGQSYTDKGGYYMMPVGAVENIEVIKGGSPVLYGSGSIGGIVNIITKKGGNTPHTDLSLQMGNASQVNIGAQTYGSTKSEKLDYYAGFHRRQGEGFRTSRSKFSTDDLTLQLNSNLSEHDRIEVFINLFDEHSDTPGGLTQAQWEQDPKQSVNPYDFFMSRRFSTSISYKRNFDENNLLSTSFYGSYLKRDWWLDNRKSDPAKRAFTGAIREIPTVGFMADYERITNFLGHKNRFLSGLRLHADTTHENSLTSQNFGEEGGVSTKTVANSVAVIEGYLYDEFYVNDQFKVSPGIRYTYAKYTAKNFKEGTIDNTPHDAWTTSLGLFYKFSEEARTYFSFSKGYQMPRFRDAFNLDASEDLGAETSNNYEAGIRVKPTPWLDLDASVYLMDFDNNLVREAGLLKNGGKTLHRGVEMELSIMPTDGLRIYGTGTIQKATFKSGEFDGNILPYAPSHMATYGVKYQIPIGSGTLTTNIYGSYVGHQFSDSKNTVVGSADGNIGEIPSYNIYNATLNYYVGQWGISLSGLNLADKKYFTNRHSAWGGIMPAATRSLMAGLEFKF